MKLRLLPQAKMKLLQAKMKSHGLDLPLAKNSKNKTKLAVIFQVLDVKQQKPSTLE